MSNLPTPAQTDVPEGHSHNLRIVTSSDNPNWRTHPDLIAGLLPMIGWRGFVFDLAADRDNRICGVWLGPGSPIAEDTIAFDVDGVLGVVMASRHDTSCNLWLNPPYSQKIYRQTQNPAMQIETWVHFCWRFARLSREYAPYVKIYSLLPYAPQTEYWRAWVEGHAENFGAEFVYRFPHRLSFLRETGEDAANANVNHAIVVWGSGLGFVGPWSTPTRYWTYRLQPAVPNNGPETPATAPAPRRRRAHKVLDRG